MMHLLLASFLDSTTARWLLAILFVGLLGSVLIGFWPHLSAFVQSVPTRLRAARNEAAGIARDPRRAAGSVEAIARLPRAAVSYGLIGLALAVWAVYAFTQPASESRAAELQHISSIGYVARGAPSVVMPDGMAAPVSAETVARTGEQPPLFSAVLSKIDFGYTYELRAPKPLNVIGVGGSALRIKAEDGWERTVVLQSSQPVSGPNVTLWFTVDLDMVRLVIVGAERETGSKSSWYDLTIVPVVRLAGEAAGARLDETYSREFNLRYDPVRITPDAQLERSERTAASGKVRVARHARAFGLSMHRSIARWVAAAGALIALAAAVALAAAKPREGAAAPDSLPANVVPHRPAPASAAPAASAPAKAAPVAAAPGASAAAKAATAAAAPENAAPVAVKAEPAASTSEIAAPSAAEPAPAAVAASAASPNVPDAQPAGRTPPEAAPVHEGAAPVVSTAAPAAPTPTNSPHSAVDVEAEALLAASVAPAANGSAPRAAGPPLERAG